MLKRWHIALGIPLLFAGSVPGGGRLFREA